MKIVRFGLMGGGGWPVPAGSCRGGCVGRDAGAERGWCCWATLLLLADDRLEYRDRAEPSEDVDGACCV